jgi:hypothetical protein
MPFFSATSAAICDLVSAFAIDLIREPGKFRENLPRAGDVKNDTAGL